VSREAGLQEPGARNQSLEMTGPGFDRARRGLRMAAALTGLLSLGMGCTDPHPRPEPPTVVVTLSTTVHPTSPGDLAGSLYLYDVNGVASARMTVDIDNGARLGDSAVVPSDPIESTQPFEWRLPGGIPRGTRIRVVVSAVSYLRFEAADTVYTAVADSAGHSR
jgi:hypothetical protein